MLDKMFYANYPCKNKNNKDVLHLKLAKSDYYAKYLKVAVTELLF